MTPAWGTHVSIAGVAVDAQGYGTIVGEIRGVALFGPTLLTACTGCLKQVYVARLDPHGAFRPPVYARLVPVISRASN